MLKKFLTALVFVSTYAHAAVNVTAARIWPANDYTRLTLESPKPITYRMTTLKNPERLVLDLDDVELNTVLKSISTSISQNDPYIQQVRIANFKPGVVRLVVDLKTEIKPKIFSLPPAGDYQNRLVLDIYPPKDPLITMLEQHEKSFQPDTVNNDATDTGNPSEGQEQVSPPSAPTQTDNASPSTQSTSQDSMVNPNVTDTKEVQPIKDKPLIYKGTRQITIAIDAGHGGEDPGAKGANGSREKFITLAVAKILKEQIDLEPNMRGILTRDGDYFIPLHGRVVKARNMQADLFVSIHADAFIRPDARGSSVFALSEKGATSASARYLAKKENESDLIGGVSLEDKDMNLARTLLDLSQTATISDSLKLGKCVLTNIGDVNALHKGSVEQAGFAVLKSPDIPSILVETAFISNPDEERKLNDEGYQKKLAASILSGIKKYLSTNPPLAKTNIATQQ